MSPPRVDTVRDAIERAAATRGEAPFLIDPATGCGVTFGHLRLRAEEIGRRLLGAGLVKGDRVAVVLDNGPPVVELVLGSMFAGLVPVPLDPAGGGARLGWILEHADAGVVVTAPAHEAGLARALARVPRRPALLRVAPEGDVVWPSPSGRSPALPRLEAADDALLIYTSGSTGRPKGVLASHGNVLAGGGNMARAHELTPADRSLCVLPLYHNNAQLGTLVPTLLTGGAVVIPDRFRVAAFWRWVTDHRCTWFGLAPAMVAQLTSWPEPTADEAAARLRHVRFVRCSSAPLASALHRAFEARFGLPLVEVLGATEAVSAIFANPLPPRPRKVGSAGLPWGFEVRIVDPAGHDRPAGEAGEIFVRGPSVMKGYYRDPDATSAVLDPDGWLRTADLGYRDEDGYVFVTGRRDEIVVRGGEKVAPREIDEVLARHPAVLEAAAASVPDSYLGEDVVAYVVLRPDGACAEADLLAFCERELGPVKTPSRIYMVEDLPRGPGGKVQRLRLGERARLDRKGTASTGTSAPVVEAVARAWAEALDREGVGLDESFFALGGTSLQAVRVLARMRRALGVELSLQEFLDHPTIARQARALAGRAGRPDGEAPAAGREPIPPRDRSAAPRLAYAQERVWRYSRTESGRLGYVIPLVYRIAGPLDVPALERAMDAVAARHDALRTTVGDVDGQPAPRVHPPRALGLRTVDLTGRAPAAEEADRLRRDEARRPFDLASEWPIRASVLRLGPEDHILLLTFHHITFDGWSLDVMGRELAILYDAFRRRQPPSLAVPGLQAADVAAWERDRLPPGGDAYRRQIDYWKRTLAGHRTPVELPCRRWQPVAPTLVDCLPELEIPAPAGRRVRTLAGREGATWLMMLTAAFATVLAPSAPDGDVVVGAYVANRAWPGAEGVVGFFSNLVLIRTDVSRDPPFRTLLEDVRERTLGALAHQGVPFEAMAGELRAAGHELPDVPVILHVKEPDAGALTLPGLTVERVELPPDGVPWGFSVFLRPEADGGFTLGAELDTGRYDPAGARALLADAVRVLERAAADPTRRLAALRAGPASGPGRIGSGSP